MMPVVLADPARMIAGGAGLVATSVLADSAAEHYRGSFANRAMLLPLAASAAEIATGGLMLAGGGSRGGRLLDRHGGRPAARIAGWGAHGTAAAVGLAGFGFHFYNVGRQPGGYRLGNLFYNAPLGAPGALVIAAAFGAGAQALAGGIGTSGIGTPGGARLRSGRLMGALSALGLLGTAAEAALLHFRGAYHNPAMWAPVILPPVVAASLAADTLAMRPSRRSFALLAATAALGIAGSAFHAYGVSRNMGGWRNWRQNLLVGPPLPAPPSFTGIAVAGIGALLQMQRQLRRGFHG